MKKIMIYGLILAVLQSVLFWQKDWGISVIIFIASAMVTLALVLKEHKQIKNKWGLILLIPIILLSSTYFIFNNAFFRVFNSMTIIGLILTMIIWVTDEQNKFKFVIHKAFALLFGGFEFFDAVGKELKANRNEFKKDNKTVQVVKAILISLPIVIIVLLLLSSADSIFGSIFGDVFKEIFSENIFLFVIRIGIAVLLFFYFAGSFINIIREKSMYTAVSQTRKDVQIKLNRFNINFMLTALNIIYLIFCTIQFMYLFTKAGIGEDFDYASYARQGFFQLMFVTFINFITMLISTINKGKEATGENVASSDEPSKRYTKIMNILICIFTIVIIFSSFFRMNLYEQEFGYTYLRLFVYFVLATELLLIVPTIMYLINEKIKLFKTYILIITGMYVILNFINIDYIIARRNIDRYFDDTVNNKIDVIYLRTSTGTDAIEQMERLLNVDDEDIKLEAYVSLYYKKMGIKEDKSWQEYNISQNKAEEKLKRLDSDGTISKMYEIYCQKIDEENQRYYEEMYNSRYNNYYDYEHANTINVY